MKKFSILRHLRNTLIQLLGEFSWQKPRWSQRFANYQHQHPVKTRINFLIALITLVVFVFAIYQYQHMPAKHYVTASIIAPDITPNVQPLAPTPLLINFYKDHLLQSVAPLAQVNKQISQGIEITPDLQGTWQWQSDSQLMFKPSIDWPAGQTYQITFQKHLFSDPHIIHQYRYSFATQPLQATISNFTIYQNPLNGQDRQGVATITFNYAIDTASFEKHISVMDEKTHQPLRLTFNYDKNKRTAYVHTQILSLNQQAYYLKLTLSKYIAAKIGEGQTDRALSQTVLVPDVLHYFSIHSVQAEIARDEQNISLQTIIIDSSLGVDQHQLAQHLQAFVLPQDYPATPQSAKLAHFHWQNPGEITPQILKLSTPLALTTQPSAHDFAALNSFQIKAPAGRFLYIIIKQGLAGLGNFTLAQDYKVVTPAPDYPQEIRFLHPGALLALASEKKLSVLTRGLPVVRFEFARVLPQHIQDLVSQTSGNFNHPYFLSTDFNQNNISEIYTETKHLAAEAGNEDYTALDLGQYLTHEKNRPAPLGLFLLTGQGWDTTNKTSYGPKSERLILMTDLSLIQKNNADHSHDVFVQSITQGNPVPGVHIQVLGKNGLPIAEQVTDKAGHVNFSSLQQDNDAQTPTGILATKGGDISFMPFNSMERTLNFSKFNIEGVYNNNDTNNLNAYVFSDRGIYKPGETVHLAAIIKAADVGRAPLNLPFVFTITDPRGNVVKEAKFTLDASGLTTLDFISNETAVTGDYTINVSLLKDGYANNLLGTTTVNITDFLPDTLRLTAHFNTTEVTGWVKPHDLQVSTQLINLFGLPATHRKMQANLLLTPQAFKFAAYPSFTFVDPLLTQIDKPKVFSDALTDSETNDKGFANFDLNLARFTKGTYRLNVYVQGFEANGGRSVTTDLNALVSPLDYLVGYKTENNLSFIKHKQAVAINLVAINRQLNAIALNKLTAQLRLLQPVSSLVKKIDGTYQYQTTLQTSVVKDQPFMLAAHENKYILDTTNTGKYVLAILDADHNEVCHIDYQVVGDSNPVLSNHAELSLKLPAGEFKAGTQLKFEIKAPFTGAGLMTIERDKVYAYKWFKTDKTATLQSLQIPKNLTGNAYLNVAFVRDWDAPEIFVNPLSYSLASFSLDHSAHQVNIDLSTEKTFKPGQPLTIHYKTSHKTKIIIFAVDKGILSAAKYKRPDPLNYFFAKKVLEVETQQTSDQILPKYIFARESGHIGGDAGAIDHAALLNPFKRKAEKPVVFWSNVLTANAQDQTVTMAVPDYFNGQLEVSAVAVSDTAVGASTVPVQVIGDYVITPNMPTFVAPGDEFDVAASVTNNTLQPTLTINLQTSESLRLLDAPTRNLRIKPGSEQTIHFKLKANDHLGNADVTWQVTGEKSYAKRVMGVSIRAASPFEVTVQSGYKKQALTQTIDRKLYAEKRDVIAAMAMNPAILLTGLKQYVDQYPFGCTEQLTSKAFVTLAGSKPSDKDHTHTAMVDRLITQLAQRQMSDGSFSYWPDVGSNVNNEFASVYALLFLTEAQALGFPVPLQMYQQGINYLKIAAGKPIHTLQDARLAAMAIYLLTRNEIMTTNYLAHLQFFIDAHLKAHYEKDILIAYMGASFALLQDKTEANRLMSLFDNDFQINKQRDDFYSPAIANAQFIYLCAKHFPEKIPSLQQRQILPLIAALNAGQLNTLSAGYTSLAISALAPARSGNILSITGIADKKETVLAVKSDDVQVSIPQTFTQVKFSTTPSAGFYYQLTQAGFDHQSLPTSAGLEILTEYTDASGHPIKTIKIGEEVYVHVKVRSLNQQYYPNIALVNLLPGGFDLNVNSYKHENSYDYVDAREDRINYFTDASPQAREFVYTLKAVSMGEFTLPAPFASSMYDHSLYANGQRHSIKVTD